VNAGIANVFTGPAGDIAVAEMAKATALVFDGRTEEVFIGSTGVIGEPLDACKIVSALPGLAAALTEDSWEAAARAIMTTDTYPKGSYRKARIGNGEVGLAGFVKGSGMIAPDMATMLGYIFTDACLPAGVLQALLTQAVADSFNCITVDSDTSTSDMILLFATGKGAAHPAVSMANDPALDDFRVQLSSICLDLAHQVIRDGEGASKFITITVDGATDDESARRIALGVGNSPLVKTALAAGDANWGRIIMAIGKSGEPVDRSCTGVAIGGVEIAADGGVIAGYDETPVAAHMAETDIDIDIKVGTGTGRATIWTCDLTHDYISINAVYRT
jgi:glutamate N-acetyltransferase/amino-acid N-acetyltransferase